MLQCLESLVNIQPECIDSILPVIVANGDAQQQIDWTVRKEAHKLLIAIMKSDEKIAVTDSIKAMLA